MFPSGRGWFIGRRLKLLLGAVALGTLACMDSASGPDGAGVGYAAFQPLLSAQVQNGQFSLGINGIGLRLQRAGTGEIVVDTLIPFDPDSAVLHAAVRVGMLRRTEEFEARLSLLDGPLVLFSGSKLIFLQQGPPGTNGLDSIGVGYEGPGRNIAHIAIQPANAIVNLGDSLQYTVVAVDSSGAPVLQFFVSWKVTDTVPGRLNAYGWLRAPRVRGAVTVTAMTPNGVWDTARATFVPKPTGLRLVGRDTVVAPVGTAVPLAVRVVASDSLGVPGVAVHFSAATAGGAVTDSVVVSDSTGIAATQVLVGDTLRVYGYEVHANGLPDGRLTVRAIAGPPAALSISGGNAQSARVGTELAAPVSVRVRDALGNPVAGQRVNFVVTSGGGSVWAGSNNTNDSGIAMERWTLGRSTAVTQQLEARAVDNTTGAPLLFGVFTATALPGPADSLRKVAGDGQGGAVGAALPESLVVEVVDRYGNPVPGAAVQWTAGAGSTSPVAGASDAQGRSRAQWVLGTTSGAQTAAAVVSGLTPVGFSAMANAGAPATMTVVSGDGQTASVGELVADSLRLRVSDAFGNPVVGQGVAWSAATGGTMSPATGATGADGVARTQWRLGTTAGTQTAHAAVSGGTLGASFSATALPGAPAVVTVSAPDTLLAALGTQAQLGAVVHDAFGNPLTGETVSWSSSDTAVAAVDATGRVTARHNGSVQITATVAGGVAGSLELTVSQAVVALTLTAPADWLPALGDTVRLAAVARDANGNVVPNVVIAWSSSDPAVAGVDQAGLVTARANGTVAITGSVGASVVSTVHVTVAQRVASVQLTPEQTTLNAVGTSVQLTLTALDSNGFAVTNATVTWASSDVSVATVSATGLVTAVASGQVTITATVSGNVAQQVALSVQVSVAPTVAQILVAPAADTLTALDQTVTLSAEALDQHGGAVSGVTIVWASSNPAIATVTAAGVVTAVANGTATITAASGGISAIASVTVAQVATRVVVTPAQDTLTAVGQTVALHAQAYDARDNAVVGSTFAWSGSDAAVATVSTDGVVSAVATGSVGITATSAGVSGSATVVVTLPVASVTVEPAGVTLHALGRTAQLAATARDANGQVVAGAVSWASADQSVATVSGSGLVTAVANGATSATAVVGGVTGTARVTVSQTAATVTVGPNTVTLTAAGATAQLTVGAADANGHAVSGAVFTWQSSDTSVARVSGTGLVTAVANGTVTVSATSGGVTGTTRVTVSLPQPPPPPPPELPHLATLAVTPGAVTLAALGATTQLAVTAHDQYGAVFALAAGDVTWTSSNASVGTVDATGLVTAVANGAATITAASGGISATASVTVAQAITALHVTPETVLLSTLGATQLLTATPTDAGGHPVSATVTWETSDAAVTTVSPAGLVTATGAGTATIRASAGGVFASVQVTVSLPAPLQVVIDIKPGRTRNSINLRSDGATPVAILTTSAARSEPVTFDAASVAAASVRFAGAAPVHSALEDVDGDGDIDLILQFTTLDLQLTATSTTATLRGQTTDGRSFYGEDSVSVIVSEPAPPMVVVNAVSVSPASAVLSAIGAGVQLTATALDASGNPLSGGTVTWATSDAAVTTVDASGLVSAAGNGVATVTATVDGVSGQASITVRQGVASVEVTPASVQMAALGATAALTAVARDANGHPVAGSVAWASSDAGVAAVSASGVVTAEGNGTATITASQGGVSGSAVVAVAQVAAGLTVSPHAVAFDALGRTAQLTFSLTDANGHGLSGSATWTASDPGIASVNAGGLVTAEGNGTAFVRAGAGDLADSAAVTVQQVVRSIVVSPATSALQVGGTVQLAATAADGNSAPVSGVTFSWTSSSGSIASVDATGMVMGVGAGEATISAATEGVSGMAAVSVASPPQQQPPPDSAIAVEIRIKVGQGDSKPINLAANGVVPVALLSSSNFDPASADVASVAFASAHARHSSTADVNGDGRPDLVLQFPTQELALTPSSTMATLTGRTRLGQAFQGSQTVRVIH